MVRMSDNNGQHEFLKSQFQDFKVNTDIPGLKAKIVEESKEDINIHKAEPRTYKE